MDSLFNRKRWSWSKLIIFFFILCPFLCYGNNKWSKWCNPKDRDLQDLAYELPLIATGTIWFCIMPYVDWENGCTGGKTISQIRDMLAQINPEDCRKSPTLSRWRQYLRERIDALSQMTVGRSFIERHDNDLENFSLQLQILLISRIVSQLCPGMCFVDEELLACVPLAIFKDVFDAMPDVKNMQKRQILEIRFRKNETTTIQMEREFRLEIDGDVLEAALDDVRSQTQDPTTPAPVLCRKGNVPGYLHIRMVCFPIDGNIPTATAVKAIYLSDV